ncbi:hypothetical protein [Stieleria varia]|uniref:Uncharacterized protein n=1 Tax=Stieleria varia TaxID=2528005 RepID=A0A5C6AFP8_9BACT|nr:hypothetical protein [Stieleria varia]TWT98260.1 hypothetical protein Pla52n_47700 [Stieleria varia]
MRRMNFHGRIILALVALSVVSTSAMADWHQFWHNMHVGFHRNNAWPDPYNDVDARDVIAPFEIMKHNGWRLNNTMGAQLFREGDGALLASGHEKLYWIATQAPPNRRNVYVLRGRNERETNARVASVRDSLARYDRNGVPELFVIDREPSTGSGARATAVNRMWMDAMPTPKLPSQSASGTAASTAP